MGELSGSRQIVIEAASLRRIFEKRTIGERSARDRALPTQLERESVIPWPPQFGARGFCIESKTLSSGIFVKFIKRNVADRQRFRIEKERGK